MHWSQRVEGHKYFPNGGEGALKTPGGMIYAILVICNTCNTCDPPAILAGGIET